MIKPSRRRSRRTVATLLAVSICLWPVASATPVIAQGSDANTAVAVNDKNGSSIFDVAFQIRRVSSGVVDQTNAAVAYASCEACQTVAVAIQIVLVSGPADTITPTNLAIAINEQCTTCQTMALAYQYVFGTGDIIGFTPEGQRRLNEIRKALRELSRSDLTLEEIRVQLVDLTGQIADVLATEIVVRGPQDGSGQTGQDELPEEEPAPAETVPQDETVPAEEGEPLPETEDPQQEVAPESDTGETETAPSDETTTAPEDPATTTTP